LESQGGAAFGVRPAIELFWDTRCAKVDYVFNSSAGANEGSDAFIAPQTLADTVQTSLNRWNDNPSSFIEMNIVEVRELGDRPRIGGDFINEVVFITPDGFTALASSLLTPLLEDTVFIAGEDLDGDGDADVYDPEEVGINVCSDVDNDGDIEFPAGEYKAGTILDNDVQFSSTAAWELEPNLDVATDVDAVATHEFGHSHGISHSLNNQISADDATGSTMFPFIDNDDSASELSERTPDDNDLAISAFIYPEGSAETGIAALQEGDIAFDEAYEVVSGTVQDADGNAIVGANVFVTDLATDRIIFDTFSGFVDIPVLLFQDILDNDGDGFTTELFAFDEAIPEDATGAFLAVVPRGGSYKFGLQAVDGDPVATGAISTTTIVAGIRGVNEFPEEFFDARGDESNFEIDPGGFTRVRVSRRPSRRATDSIDFIINEDVTISNGPITDENSLFDVFDADPVQTFSYAEVFDREDVIAQLDAGLTLVSATLRTDTSVSSIAPIYSNIRLVLVERGDVDFTFDDGSTSLVPSFEIARNISEEYGFVGQEDEYAPFFIRFPKGNSRRLARLLEFNPEYDVAIILEADLTTGRLAEDQLLGIQQIDTGTAFFSWDGSPFLGLSEIAFNIDLNFSESPDRTTFSRR